MPDNVPDAESERLHRDGMWQRLLSCCDPAAVQPRVLDEVGIRPHRTGHGIFRDKERTQAIAPEGIALSLLDTGTTYDDAFDAEGGLYYYPATEREGSRDSGEIESMRNACRLGLPIFVILRGPRPETRNVRRGWITALDDRLRASLIEFGETLPTPPESVSDQTAFSLRAPRRSNSLPAERTGRARFRFQVLRRSGPRCAFCPVSHAALLEVVRLCPAEDDGTDDPRNGLVACRNHSRAFMANLVAIDPDSLGFVTREHGPTLIDLGIPQDSLSRLKEAPHRDALAWRFRSWGQRAEVTRGSV